MNISIQQCGAVSVVQPSGPLTGEAGEILKNQLQTQINERLGRVVLDASDISHLDSQGLESLLDVTEGLGLSGPGPQAQWPQSHRARGLRSHRSGSTIRIL